MQVTYEFFDEDFSTRSMGINYEKRNKNDDLINFQLKVVKKEHLIDDVIKIFE